MDVYILVNTGQLFHVLKNFRFIIHLWVTATSFVISIHVDDRKAMQMHTKQPINERLLHYQLSNMSAGIPIAC